MKKCKVMRRVSVTIALLVLGAAQGGAFAQTAPSARPKGDQHREYTFAPTGQRLPYRIYVPMRWDGKSSLPIVLFLHGAGANESTYLDIAGGLLEKLAEQHGYIVVSPLGFTPLGAYGNPLRLPAVFGESATAATQRAAVTPERQRELDLSELEVITALEIVTEEYGADRSRTFLAGHSMGSGGVWHLAARYPERWRAIAPMSGPFVDRETYPFDRIRDFADFRDGRHRRRRRRSRAAGRSRVHARGRLRVRVPRGRRQSRQHGADGLARDLRFLRPRPGARRAKGAMSMPFGRLVLCGAMALFCARLSYAQTEIRLRPDGARGSERSAFAESVTRSPSGDRIITNVSDPTLTVFLPDPAKASGAAVVDCAGRRAACARVRR